MTFAWFERANRRYQEFVVGNLTLAARIGAFLQSWRAKALAIDAAADDCHALAIDARGSERIGHAARDRDHSVDRAIVKIGREYAVGPVVHPPRNDQRSAKATREGRHRMRA